MKIGLHEPWPRRGGPCPETIPGPNGPVEFIGLKQWNAQKLFDAIQELDPDRPFHACAAVMKMDLGFADAAAFSYMTGFSADPVDWSGARAPLSALLSVVSGEDFGTDLEAWTAWVKGGARGGSHPPPGK